jgi:hypothetical protein
MPFTYIGKKRRTKICNSSKYEGGSVNRKRMDIKRKTCDIRTNRINNYFSTYPLLTNLSRRYTSASKLATLKSFDCCVSHFCTSVSTSSSSAKRLSPVVNHFRRQTLPKVNRTHFFTNMFWIASFRPRNSRYRSFLFGSKLCKHGCHFDYWNQPLNMSMHVCYLDCHEGGLWCYLVIYTENILRHYSCFTSICDVFTDSLSLVHTYKAPLQTHRKREPD